MMWVKHGRKRMPAKLARPHSVPNIHIADFWELRQLQRTMVFVVLFYAVLIRWPVGLLPLAAAEWETDLRKIVNEHVLVGYVANLRENCVQRNWYFLFHLRAWRFSWRLIGKLMEIEWFSLMKCGENTDLWAATSYGVPVMKKVWARGGAGKKFACNLHLGQNLVLLSYSVFSILCECEWVSAAIDFGFDSMLIHVSPLMPRYPIDWKYHRSLTIWKCNGHRRQITDKLLHTRREIQIIARFIRNFIRFYAWQSFE